MQIARKWSFYALDIPESAVIAPGDLRLPVRRRALPRSLTSDRNRGAHLVVVMARSTAGAADRPSHDVF